MRITVVNDTRVEVNPGCHATVTALERLLREVSGGDLRTVPLGAGHGAFAPMVTGGHGRSASHWHEAVTRLAGDAAVMDAIEDADLMVVNLEGTFHHHTVGALALGGMIGLAHRRRLPVWAVNGTVQDIDLWLLQESLAKVAHLAVREPVSAAWLRRRGLRASLAADCALLADVFESPLPWSLPRRAALYTPGVLARPDQAGRIDAATVEAQLAVLARRGLTPIYFEMEDAEAPISERIRAAGGLTLRAADVPWQMIGTLVRGCELVVSGRYHMLLFAAMAGVPCVAMRSNTWKIDGLLEHLGATQPVSETAADVERVLAAGSPATASPSMLMRLRTLARRNVAGHPDARVVRSRVEPVAVVIGPSLDAAAAGQDAASTLLPWPSSDPGHAAAHLRQALDAARHRRSGRITVAGLASLPAERIPDVLLALRESAPPQIDVVIDPSPGECWTRAVGTLRPTGVWRRLFTLAGFDLQTDSACEPRDLVAGSPRAHWRSINPFRDEADRVARRFRLCPASGDGWRGARPALGALLGLWPAVPVPDAITSGQVRPVFVVGTYQEFRQYLPVLAQLPSSTCTVLVRREHGAALERRRQCIEDWLQRRNIRIQVIDSVRDIDWPGATGSARAVLVSGAESTAYDSHLWTAAVVVAARDRGVATVQLQHGIWPYADLERPMTWLSDVALTWSGEFEAGCRQTVTWKDGTREPVATVGGVRFLTTGCPLFDRYAEASHRSLEEALGSWVTTFRRRVLVATNLHWTQHRNGASVTPALLALARRTPDTLFVVKPHPVHDIEAGVIDSCPPNVVVLDEYACLLADLDSPLLIRACDAVISTHSTMVLEAALAEKPFVVVDSGNPNRYEHVVTHAPSAMDDALEAALADGVPSSSAFMNHYFDRRCLGHGASLVLRALVEASEAARVPLEERRHALALSRFAEFLSVYSAEVAGNRVRLAAQASSQERHRADAAAMEHTIATLSLRCAHLETLAAARDADLLRPRVDRPSKVVLFGASAAGAGTLAIVRHVPYLDVIGFADNDPSKWGTRFEGVPVHEPDGPWLRTADIIVITSIHRPAIAAQLASSGCADRLVFDNDMLMRIAQLARTA